MASNKEIRPTWFYWNTREASSWEIIFFAAYLKKQHKGRDKGCEHRQTFPSISTILFLLSVSTLFIIFSWGFPVGRIFSAPTIATKNLRKTKLQKTRVNVTIVDTFYRYPYTASAVICKSANNTRLTSNIQQNSITEISKKHQFPEKTDIGTVKMVKDHCEATAR